jgi:hypothetical protein
MASESLVNLPVTNIWRRVNAMLRHWKYCIFMSSYMIPLSSLARLWSPPTLAPLLSVLTLSSQPLFHPVSVLLMEAVSISETSSQFIWDYTAQNPLTQSCLPPHPSRDLVMLLIMLALFTQGVLLINSSVCLFCWSVGRSVGPSK